MQLAQIGLKMTNPTAAWAHLSLEWRYSSKLRLGALRTFSVTLNVSNRPRSYESLRFNSRILLTSLFLRLRNEDELPFHA